MEGAENKAVHVLCRYRRGGPWGASEQNEEIGRAMHQ
jgi:hypothetical protein